MKKTAAFTLIVMVLLIACKKKKEEISLNGKWNVENTITKEYVNGVLLNTIDAPGYGSTIDFQSNGNLLITAPGSPDQSFQYIIKADSKVEIDGDTYEIRNLNPSGVTLFIHEDFGTAVDYNETFLNLKR
jgi:hypothetical protein